MFGATGNSIVSGWSVALGGVLHRCGELFSSLAGPGRRKPLVTPKVRLMLPQTLAQLADIVHGEAHGDGALEVSGICSVENPRAGSIAMAESAEHLEALEGSGVVAILHSGDLRVAGPGLLHAQPRIAFARLLDLFHPEPKVKAGIHPTAVVDPRASVDASAEVGPHCTIGPGAVIGANCYLQAFVSVAEGAVLGPDCRLYAHVTVGRDSHLEGDCRLEPWAQLGNKVRLGAGVDLGSHTALAHGVTVEPGAKFDNLVVVGARSRVGAGTLLVGQSSVDRDAVLHPGVVLAGQSAVGPEAELFSGVQLGGRSWALGKLDKPGPYLGNPARPLKEEMRRCALERKNG